MAYCIRNKSPFSILSLLTLLLTGVGPHSYSQTPSIEYDFESEGFNSLLPFDQTFQIIFKNIEPSTESILLQIREIPNTNRIEHSLKKKGITTITNEKLFNCSDCSDLVFIYEKGGGPFNNRTTKLGVLNQLKPNKDYFFEISELKPLNSTERQELTEQLKKDGIIRSYFSELGQISLKSTDSHENFIIENQDLLNEIGRKAVNGINSNYRFVPIRSEQLRNFYLAQILEFMDFLDGIKNISKAYKELLKDLPSELDKAKITELHNKLEKYDWGDYKDMSEIDNLASDLEEIKAKITSAVDKAQIDYIKTNLDKILTAKNDLISTITQNLIAQNTSGIINSTYHNDAVKNAGTYFTADFGMVWPYKLTGENLFTYVGATIYFRPINRSLPLSRYRGVVDFCLTRFSVTTGLTVNSIEREGVRTGVFGTSGVILGLGFRPLNWLKVSYGGVGFYALETNPLASEAKKQLSFTPYIGVSIDLDISESLKSTFSKKQ